MDLKSNPNSDEFGKVGLGEEFCFLPLARHDCKVAGGYQRTVFIAICIGAPFKYVLGNFWIWAVFFKYWGGLLNGGSD